MLKTNLVLISCLLVGCTDHINGQHFTAEINEGFMRSFVVTCPKLNGQVLESQCKTTLCNGYSGLVSDVLKDAAIVGSAALIGAGLGSSGDSNNTNINNRSSSNSGASSNATASANASSGASSSLTGNAPVMPPKPHHYRELKPHEHGYYGVD